MKIANGCNTLYKNTIYQSFRTTSLETPDFEMNSNTFASASTTAPMPTFVASATAAPARPRSGSQGHFRPRQPQQEQARPHFYQTYQLPQQDHPGSHQGHFSPQPQYGAAPYQTAPYQAGMPMMPPFPPQTFVGAGAGAGPGPVRAFAPAPASTQRPPDVSPNYMGTNPLPREELEARRARVNPSVARGQDVAAGLLAQQQAIIVQQQQVIQQQMELLNLRNQPQQGPRRGGGHGGHGGGPTRHQSAGRQRPGPSPRTTDAHLAPADVPFPGGHHEQPRPRSQSRGHGRRAPRADAQPSASVHAPAPTDADALAQIQADS